MDLGGLKIFPALLYIPKLCVAGHKTLLLGILRATIIHTCCQREYISILMNLCSHFYGGYYTSYSEIFDAANFKEYILLF